MDDAVADEGNEDNVHSEDGVGNVETDAVGREEASEDENDEWLQPRRTVTQGWQRITSDSESDRAEDDKADDTPAPPKRTKRKKGPPPNFNIEFSTLSTTESGYERPCTPELDDANEPNPPLEILSSTQGK